MAGKGCGHLARGATRIVLSIGSGSVAASRGYCQIVQTLLAAGADVNAKDNAGKTALRATRFSTDGAGKVTILKAAGARQ